ncbi:MAG: (d)CMP kinase [Firmicutes bacterium]|nr:(d)CMP kinase [Bacillota bacterium]
MTDIFRIAIDGPSGAGKSTIAKKVAKELNIDYIDTGAMYRAVGYKMNREGVPFEECDALKEMLDATDIDFASGDIILDGEIVNTLIRTPEVSMLASKCSALPMVREKLVEIQRAMGTRKSVIMDGRDIGTNVLKDAEYKIFLTASAEERADRRFKELQEKGEDQSYEDVLADIKQRDHNDTTRKLNPLKKADDAIELDTTGMGIDDVVKAVLEIAGK